MPTLRRAVFDTNVLISAYLWPGIPRTALDMIRSGRSMLVSGDRHLLDLRRYRRIRILTPAEFVRSFREIEGA